MYKIVKRNRIRNFILWTGIISFSKPKDTEEVLNAWSGNLNSVMNLIGNCNHLITKERMVCYS